VVSDELIQLRDQVGVLRRRWYIVVVTVLACLLAGLFYVSRATPTYVATADVLLGAPTSKDGKGLTASQLATEARVVTAAGPVSDVNDFLGLRSSLGALVHSVVVEPDPSGAAVLQITVTRQDPREAAAIANGLAREYVNGRAPSVVKDAEILHSAIPPKHADSPKKTPTLIFAGVLGLLLGLGLSFLRHYFDESVRDEGDAAGATRRPVLGRIPHGRRAIHRSPVALNAPGSRVGEAYRALAATIRYRLSQLTPRTGEQGRGRVVLVTSASAGEGKTQTAVNTAVAAASAGLDVVLVDADLRNGGVGTLFELPPGPGVSEALTDSADLQVRLKSALVDTELERLRVLPAGAPTSRSAELLAAPGWASLLDELRAGFDLVVIDSPPVLPVVDTLEMVHSADLTILVVRRHVSRRRQLAAAIDRVEQVGGTVDGVVVCDVARSANAHLEGRISAPQRGPTARPSGSVTEDTRTGLDSADDAGTHDAEELPPPRQSRGPRRVSRKGSTVSRKGGTVFRRSSTG
jgi:succinoglycan biosynthesis transport protein ExoP